MKTYFIAVLCLAITVSAQATTKTVAQDGSGDFTSIQAAIDSFTQAELTDGTPDEVIILDSAEYDEQVSVGAPEVTESSPSNFLDDAIQLAMNRDPFTLKGSSADSKPIIEPIAVDPKTYGAWPGDPTDNFAAAVAFYGKDLTFENLEIRRSGAFPDFQGDDEYGVNGQAGNTVFRNVLFQVTGDGDSLINFNNNAENCGYGFDNSYTFESCTFDGDFENDGRTGSDAVYFHGISDGDAADAGLDPSVIIPNVTFTDCTFREFENVTMIRGRNQANVITVQNSVFTGNLSGVNANGNGVYTIENNIFFENANQPDDFSNGGAACVRVTGRDGYTAEVNITNNLFADNLLADEFGDLSGLSSGAAIRIQNDGTDQTVSITNNTFVNNPVAIRFADGSGRARNAEVNNNIIQGSISAAVSADDVNGSYLTADNVNANGEAELLVVTGSGNIFDGNDDIVEDQDLLPNVTVDGTEQAVSFTNPSIDANDPFAGPPYTTTLDAGWMAGGASVDSYMLY